MEAINWPRGMLHVKTPLRNAILYFIMVSRLYEFMQQKYILILAAAPNTLSVLAKSERERLHILCKTDLATKSIELVEYVHASNASKQH